jgi:short-subunit dehydrogenase
MPFNGAYCASKFALEAVTDALRIELKPWRIPVSNVLPGDIRTEIWERAIRSIDTASARWSAEIKDLYYFLEKLPTRLRDRVILTRLRKIPPYGGP